MVKNLPAMQETPVQFLGQEDPLEKGQATHSSILGLPCGSSGKESTCNAGDLGSIPGLGRYSGEGKGYSTLVFWPGEFQGLYGTWGCQELDTTEQLSIQQQSIPGGLVVKKISPCQCGRHGFPSLGLEDTLEKEMATHSSIFAWEILWTEKPELDTTQ